MQNNIVLVGVGGVGYRHFQSLMDLTREINLVLVDKSDEALNRAKAYIGEINNAKIKVMLQNDMEGLPSLIDVLIIAISSMARRDIFERIVNKSQVRFVIFEKFLFPSPEDYEAVKKLLKQKGISAYVNTPCRLYPGYIELRKRLKGMQHIDVLVSGSNWGLACNIIHTIDMLDFLMDSPGGLVCDSTLLDDMIHESKRNGYIEFTGRMNCWLGDSASIILDSEKTGDSIGKTTIYAGDTIYTISETEQTMVVSTKGVSTIELFPIFYQSKLTSQVIKDLLDTGKCGLTRYERSAQWHLALLNAFMEKYDSVTGEKHDMCPIT